MAEITDAYVEEQLSLLRPHYAEWFRDVVHQCMKQQDADRTEAALNRFVATLPAGLPDAVRLTLLYDALRSYMTYDYEKNAARYTYPVALFSGRAVCIGIADLFSIICQKVSLDCRVIVGYAGRHALDGGSLHAWNQVRIAMDKGSPRWYHCDPTWDLGSGAPHYFLKSDAYMKKHDHYWRQPEYPPCPCNAKRIPRIPAEVVSLARQAIKVCTR